MEYQAKLNENTHPLYIAFQVLKVPKKIHEMQPTGLLLLIVLHLFLHQQISFVTTF